MSKGLSALTVNTFELHQRLKVLKLIIEIARTKTDIPNSKIKKLNAERSKLSLAVELEDARVLKKMTLACNIQPVGDSPWVFISCRDDEPWDSILLLEPIIPSCLSLITSDARENSPLTKSELLALLPKIRDENELRRQTKLLESLAEIKVNELITGTYKGMGDIVTLPEPVMDGLCGKEQSINETTSHPVKQITEQPNKGNKPTEACGEVVNGPEPIQQEDNAEISVSLHAGMRMVQRSLGIVSESMAEAHYKLHEAVIRKEIIDNVNKSVILWQDRSFSNGVDYWIDDNNMVYVVGHELPTPMVVTVYTLDFGFSPDINRLIALEQVKVIEASYVKWAEESALIKSEQEDNEKRLSAMKDELELIRATLKNKEAECKHLEALMAKRSTEGQVYEQEFLMEHAKVFKKWKREVSDQ